MSVAKTVNVPFTFATRATGGAEFDYESKLEFESSVLAPIMERHHVAIPELMVERRGTLPFGMGRKSEFMAKGSFTGNDDAVRGALAELQSAAPKFHETPNDGWLVSWRTSPKAQ